MVILGELTLDILFMGYLLIGCIWNNLIHIFVLSVNDPTGYILPISVVLLLCQGQRANLLRMWRLIAVVGLGVSFIHRFWFWSCNYFLGLLSFYITYVGKGWGVIHLTLLISVVSLLGQGQLARSKPVEDVKTHRRRWPWCQLHPWILVLIL